VVLVKSKPETLETLLARESEDGIHDEGWEQVHETFSDPKKLKDFGFSDALVGRGQALAEAVNDESPEFVVVRTEEGWSRSGRLYDGRIMESIAEQVTSTQPIAHLGHIPVSDLETALPDPQTTWFAAITKKEPSQAEGNKGNLITALYTAGYNLPGAKIRTFLKTKAVNATSWDGKADQVPVPGKGVKVVGYLLTSLDWARKGREGMTTSRVVALAREMSNGTKEGSTKMGDENKSLAEVTPEEFKEGNPNAYALIASEITAEKDTEIEALETVVEAAKADKTLLEEIRGVLKMSADDDVLAQIGKLMRKLGEKAKQSVDEALDKVLAEKVPDEETRKLVRRLVPVSEMRSKAADLPEDAKAEDVDKLVREMVEESFDSDEVIQTYVSEMAPPLVRREEELRGGKVDYEKLGMKRERVAVGDR
jgi:hypothetical protein